MNLPVFTLKDIILHRLSSGKNKNTVISRTLKRGRKLKNKGYLCSDPVFAKSVQIILSQLKQNVVLVRKISK